MFGEIKEYRAHALEKKERIASIRCIGRYTDNTILGGYVYLEVFPLTEDGDELKSKAQYIGGVESDDENYIMKLAKELASECK